MKVDQIKTAEDALRFIQGCLNDLETGVSDRNETEMNLILLCGRVADIQLEKSKQLKLFV